MQVHAELSFFLFAIDLILVFALDSLTLGTCQPGGDQSGVMSLVSPPIALGGAAGVTFRHYVATEPRYDGGNVKVAVNQGAFTVVPAAAYVFNAYNDTLLSAASGNTNPMGGQAAWSGADQGHASGSWGTSRSGSRKKNAMKPPRSASGAASAYRRVAARAAAGTRAAAMNGNPARSIFMGCR